MLSKSFLLLAVLVAASLQPGEAEAAYCEAPWLTFKDEYCVQVFPQAGLLTFSDAEAYCITATGTATPDFEPSLPIIQDEEYENFIFQNVYNSTADISDSFWLGGRYYDEISKPAYYWVNGDPVDVVAGSGYNNWAPGQPSKYESDRCMEARSPLSLWSDAKWYETSCNMHRVVVCQKNSFWTLEKTATEVKKLRRRVTALEPSA